MDTGTSLSSRGPTPGSSSTRGLSSALALSPGPGKDEAERIRSANPGPAGRRRTTLSRRPALLELEVHQGPEAGPRRALGGVSVGLPVKAEALGFQLLQPVPLWAGLRLEECVLEGGRLGTELASPEPAAQWVARLELETQKRVVSLGSFTGWAQVPQYGKPLLSSSPSPLVYAGSRLRNGSSPELSSVPRRQTRIPGWLDGAVWLVGEKQMALFMRNSPALVNQTPDVTSFLSQIPEHLSLEEPGLLYTGII
ncbi:hypothetical protein CB1_001222011 [Camelus ferus]|nr:hypothetical protein CB1_001222011 [Camelus ferus]